jgi:hypothetical protein
MWLSSGNRHREASRNHSGEAAIGTCPSSGATGGCHGLSSQELLRGIARRIEFAPMFRDLLARTYPDILVGGNVVQEFRGRSGARAARASSFQVCIATAMARRPDA